MADLTKTNLDANETTQTFSSTSTINKNDYKLRNDELGLITGNSLNLAWNEHNTSIQICMKKLNALNSVVNQEQIDNCFSKMRSTYDMLYH